MPTIATRDSRLNSQGSRCMVKHPAAPISCHDAQTAQFGYYISAHGAACTPGRYCSKLHCKSALQKSATHCVLSAYATCLHERCVSMLLTKATTTESALFYTRCDFLVVLSKLNIHFISQHFSGLLLQCIDLIISQASLHAAVCYAVAVAGPLLHVTHA